MSIPVTEETMKRIADALEKIADNMADEPKPVPAPRARRGTPEPFFAPEALARTYPQLPLIPTLGELFKAAS